MEIGGLLGGTTPSTFLKLLWVNFLLLGKSINSQILDYLQCRVFIKHWRSENPAATTWNFLAKFHWPVEA